LRYLLGIDFGGDASKATLLTENGDVVCSVLKEYPMKHPRIGWAEQSPEDCYRALVENVRFILKTTAVPPESIEALALDAATHIAVLLDKEDRVIRPAIHWSDRRSTAEANWLYENQLETVSKKSLNYPNALWTLPQLMWIRENEPENHARIGRVLFLKDYMRYRLTGDFVTDEVEAMGSMLLDANHNVWADELCAFCGLKTTMLPQIVSPMQIVSRLTDQAVNETGLSKSMKVIAGSTDTVMEVFASGSIRTGQMTVKLATAGRICPVTDHGIPHPMLVNYRHVVPGLWYPGTATKTCAASYRWYRDIFCLNEMRLAKERSTEAYSYMNEEAAKIAPGCAGLFYHPYLQGEATPYMDDSLRASFVGVTSYHTKGHFNRAVMEGVCYSLKECLVLLQDLGVAPESANVIGGGAKSAIWRQITADVLGIPLRKNVCDDSSMGSAMLAGVASGIFESFTDSVQKCIKLDCETYPDPEAQSIYRKEFLRYRQIHDALAPIYRGMVD
jgi:xylulokinase